jgi:hypothetical protein
MALYATPQNFERLGMVDPDYETEEQRIARLQRESNMTASEDKYLKEADLLKRYLKNKVVSNTICNNIQKMNSVCILRIFMLIINTHLKFSRFFFFNVPRKAPNMAYG